MVRTEWSRTHMAGNVAGGWPDFPSSLFLAFLNTPPTPPVHLHEDRTWREGRWRAWADMLSLGQDHLGCIWLGLQPQGLL